MGLVPPGNGAMMESKWVSHAHFGTLKRRCVMERSPTEAGFMHRGIYKQMAIAVSRGATPVAHFNQNTAFHCAIRYGLLRPSLCSTQDELEK